MFKFLQGLGIVTILLSFLISMALETPGQQTIFSYYFMFGGTLTGIFWLALAHIVKILEKINQNLTK